MKKQIEKECRVTEFTTQRISKENMMRVKEMRNILNKTKKDFNYNRLSFDDMISFALTKWVEEKLK